MEEFLRTLSDMELVALQNEARKADDKPLLKAVLEVLGEREKETKNE